jgi:hypothetical protein
LGGRLGSQRHGVRICPGPRTVSGSTVSAVTNGPPLFWSVHVETPGWGSWLPWRCRRLKRRLKATSGSFECQSFPRFGTRRSGCWCRYTHTSPSTWLVSAAEASRFACAAVETALEQVRVEAPAEPWIISTDGLAAPEEAYQAARRKRGARCADPQESDGPLRRPDAASDLDPHPGRGRAAGAGRDLS